MNNTIEIYGIKIIPNKSGIYKGCPFGCDKNSKYGLKSWKTEKGIRNHLEQCYLRPDKVEKRELENSIKLQKENELKNKLLSECKLKIGDKIIFLSYYVSKPTHVNGRRVRYEEERVYFAKETEIYSIEAKLYYGNIRIVFNKTIADYDLRENLEIAEKEANEKQAAYKEHCKFSSDCR